MLCKSSKRSSKIMAVIGWNQRSQGSDVYCRSSKQSFDMADVALLMGSKNPLSFDRKRVWTILGYCQLPNLNLVKSFSMLASCCSFSAVSLAYIDMIMEASE